MKIEELPITDRLDKDTIEMVQKKQDEYKYVGSMRSCAGHTLFSYNRKTGEVKKAQLECKVSIGMNGQPVYKRNIAIEPDCYYDTPALKAHSFRGGMKTQTDASRYAI